MSADPKGDEAGATDLVQLHALLRRVVGARVRDPDVTDDVVQETVARVLAVRGRLDDGALAPYAVVTARNLVRSLGRDRVAAPTTQPPSGRRDYRAVARGGSGSRRGEGSPGFGLVQAGVRRATRPRRSSKGPMSPRWRGSRLDARCRRCPPHSHAAQAPGRVRARSAAGRAAHRPLQIRLAALWPFLAAWQLVKRFGRGASRAGRWARGHPVHATGAATGFAVVAVSVEILAPPPFPVTVDQQVSFVGYVDPNHEDSVERYGLAGSDADQLRAEGYHLHAEASALPRA